MVNKFKEMRNLLFILIGLSALSISAFSQENVDIILNPNTRNIGLPDSIMRKLAGNAEQIDSLKNANAVLKDLLKESQKETEAKERKIANLQRQIDDLMDISIKRLEAKNDTLQRRLINMATNFLYIPYEEYSIEEIAIPAFMSTKGTSAYERYQNRLSLLQNYNDDISNIIILLKQAEKDLAIGLTKLRENKATEYLSNLSSLPLYKRYTQYDDWQNTYLGIQIGLIQRMLKSPDEGVSAKLKPIRTKLEELLNTH